MVSKVFCTLALGICVLSLPVRAEIPVVEPTLEILPEIDASWSIAEFANGNWRAGGAEVPVKGPALKNAVKNQKGPLAVHIPPKTWSIVGIEALNNLHKANVQEIAIAVQQGAKVRYIAYCAEKAKTCFGKPWRGVAKKIGPSLFVDAKNIEIGATGLMRKKPMASVDEELEKLKTRFAKAPTLAVSSGKNTRFGDLVNILAKSTFQSFTLTPGKAKSSGALLGFEGLLGDSPLSVGDIGDSRKKNGSSIERSSGQRGNVAAIGSKVEQADTPNSGPSLEKNRSTVDVELDEDFAAQKLPKGFMKKVAERLRSGTPRIHGCYLAAKKKKPELVGQITVKFRVDKAGNVISTEILRDELSNAVGPCVKSVMAKMAFPKPPSEDGVVLANTFVFENE